MKSKDRENREENTKRLIIVAELFGKMVVPATVVTTVYFLFQGLQSISSAGSENIRALAVFMHEFNIPSILGGGIGVTGAAAGTIQTVRLRRMTRLKSHFQKIVEKNDPNRTGSELTEEGLTP